MIIASSLLNFKCLSWWTFVVWKRNSMGISWASNLVIQEEKRNKFHQKSFTIIVPLSRLISQQSRITLALHEIANIGKVCKNGCLCFMWVAAYGRLWQEIEIKYSPSPAVTFSLVSTPRTVTLLSRGLLYRQSDIRYKLAKFNTSQQHSGTWHLPHYMARGSDPSPETSHTHNHTFSTCLNTRSEMN